MRLCAISRTLGKHLGYVAAPATGVSSTSATGARHSRSDNTNPPDAASASPAGRDYQLP
jgi:hypothetical protein